MNHLKSNKKRAAKNVEVGKVGIGQMMITMRFTLLLSLLLLLLVLPFQSSTRTPPPEDDHNDNLIITETCKKCAQTDPNISYNFCVTSLEASPDSHCVDDLLQVGKISLRLTKHNVSDTGHFVKRLLKNKDLDPYLRSCLDDCLELYSDAILTLKEAIKDYNSKRYVDANFKVSSVMDASTTCEDGFKDKEGAVSPLTQRNDHVFQLSAIGLSIMNTLNPP